MKKALLFFLSTFVLLSNAQITFYLSDLPTVGWNHRVAKDTIISAQNWGNKGANQTYTFTNFQTMFYDTILYKSLTTTQQSRFPNGDIGITTDNVNFLIGNSTTTDFRYEGLEGVLQGCPTFVNFNPVSVAFKFPTVYGGNFKDSTYFQKQVTGACVGQPIVSDVRITSSTSARDTIDGWGKVTTPVGSYKCVRQKRVERNNLILEYRLTAISPWTVLSNTTTVNPRYYYLTKEAKGSVITFDYDSVNNPIKATWSTVPPALCIADFGATVNGGTVSFHDSTDGYPDTYSWNFGDGSATSSAQNPTHTYAASGAYYVCLTVTNPSGSNMFCDSVHISNFAPIATNDNASMTQPGQVTISPTGNDSDPDNDPLCVTAVWGSPASWLTISGCNSVVYNPTDSLFSGLDTFYYKVCDNKSPQLCDTGMVIVNVAACAWPSAVIKHFCTNGTSSTSCGWSSKFVATHSSVDSLRWHLTNIFPETNLLDTFLTNIDSFGVKNSILGAYPDYISIGNTSVRACCTFYSSCGAQTLCDSVYIVIEGINEINPNAVKLYPNPASDKLNIDLSALNSEDRSDIAAIVLYDALGQKVQTVSYHQQTIMNTDIAGLPSGIYTVCVSGQTNAKKTIGRVQVMH